MLPCFPWFLFENNMETSQTNKKKKELYRNVPSSSYSSPFFSSDFELSLKRLLSLTFGRGCVCAGGVFRRGRRYCQPVHHQIMENRPFLVACCLQKAPRKEIRKKKTNNMENQMQTIRFRKLSLTILQSVSCFNWNEKRILVY